MVSKIPRTYSRYNQQALFLLGQRIQVGRKQRRWTTQELAGRVGVSRATLQKIESGDPRCEIGLAFEAAVLVGVPLFVEEPENLPSFLATTQEKLALLPKRVRGPVEKVEDEF